MNKKRIVEILKNQQKEICKDCNKKDIDACFGDSKATPIILPCKIHKLVNSIIGEIYDSS